MHYTVGKLAALAIVVGIGVGVVIHAQRGMQTDEPADEQSATDPDVSGRTRDADLPEESDRLPQQDEPEYAADDGSDVVPAADKTAETMLTASARKKKIVRTGGGSSLNDIDRTDDELELSDSRSRKSGDPFAVAEDDETPAKPIQSAPRATASAPPAAIDILDMDEDSASEPSPREQRARPARSAVLSLDDVDDSDDDSPAKKSPDKLKADSGPRLLGATDDSAEKQAPVETDDEDDLLPQDDPPPVKTKVPRTLSLEDDLNLTDDDETPSPPRKLADDGKLGGSRRKMPKAESPKAEFDDDDLSLDPPAARRSPPAGDASPRNELEDADTEGDPGIPDLPGKPVIEKKRPAELNRTIEIDDTPPAVPVRPKAPLPQITIEKQAPATAVLGRPMVYYIHVRNVGAIPAHQVVVEDAIPDGVQIDGSIPQAMLKDHKLIWKIGTLPAGQEKKISVRVIPQSEGTIGGVATVNFSGEPERSRAPAPQLKFDVTAPRQAAVGTPVEFQFHVRNVGTVPARGVTIRDVLPAGLKHPDGDDLEYNLGELPAGKSQEVKLTLTAAQAGPTVNRVVVTADGDVAEEAQVQLDVVGPSLGVSRSGPKKMIPNKTAAFTNTITNPGHGQVAGVTIIEKIPPGMEFVEAGEGGVYDQSKRSVFWSIKQLNAGDSRTVTVSLKALSRGAQISVVRAYDSSGSTGEATGATKVAGVPALTIEIGELPALVEAGETVKVPVRILNRGSDSAGNMRATIAVPPRLQIVSVDGPTSYREHAADPANGSAVSTIEVQFAPIETIEPRADAVFVLTLRAGDPGTFPIDIQAQCDQLPNPIRRQEAITVAAP